MLELGGYNPLIVLADADLEYAVNASAFGAYLHQGQICMSARQIIVERSIADEFVRPARGEDEDAEDRRPEGARHDHRAAHHFDALATGQERASTTPSRRERTCSPAETPSAPCYEATLLADVPEDSEFAKIETFGPVAAIELVDSADEAVARANATSYGLSAGIITSDADRGFALAQRIEAGIVHVNDQPVGDEPQMPFGGVKDCGWGRFGGQAVVDEFTELRWVTVSSGSHPFPF